MCEETLNNQSSHPLLCSWAPDSKGRISVPSQGGLEGVRSYRISKRSLFSRWVSQHFRGLWFSGKGHDKHVSLYQETCSGIGSRADTETSYGFLGLPLRDPRDLNISQRLLKQYLQQPTCFLRTLTTQPKTIPRAQNSWPHDRFCYPFQLCLITGHEWELTTSRIPAGHICQYEKVSS